MPHTKATTAMTSRQTNDIAILAKALGHPARIQIILTLLEKQTCIGCDLSDAVNLAASTTSEHLRILKAAGIVTGQIEHPYVCYSLNTAALEPIQTFLSAIADSTSQQIKELI